MNGQRVGYIRVSSFDQNPERQLDQVQVDRVFTDKASGKDTQRPVHLAAEQRGRARQVPTAEEPIRSLAYDIFRRYSSTR